MNNDPHTCKLQLVWCKQIPLCGTACIMLSLGSVVYRYSPTVQRLECDYQHEQQWPQWRRSAFYYPNTSQLEERGETIRTGNLDTFESKEEEETERRQ